MQLLNQARTYSLALGAAAVAIVGSVLIFALMPGIGGQLDSLLAVLWCVLVVAYCKLIIKNAWSTVPNARQKAIKPEKMVHVSDKQWYNMCYVLEEDETVVYRVTRYSKMQIAVLVWPSFLYEAGFTSLVIYYRWVVEPALFVTLVLLGPVMFFVEIFDWWISFAMVTNKYLRLVKIPPKGLPYVPSPNIPFEVKYLRVIRNEDTVLGQLAGYGTVICGTQLQDKEDKPIQEIKWIPNHKEFIIDLTTARRMAVQAPDAA